MTETSFILELASHPNSIAKIEPYVNRIVNQYDISEDLYGNILISLTEAVNNAIIHGNDNEKDKYVTVQLKHKRKNIIFSVSDEGNGFDYSNLPDPTAPENLLKLGGRGIFLMRQLSDSMDFVNDGRTVEIQFQL